VLKGDLLVVRTGGGGGYGPLEKRSLADTERDTVLGLDKPA
jgi:N-methylhydantoinase B/oxoprolinase/acetone carboxylase alpha subunit